MNPSLPPMNSSPQQALMMQPQASQPQPPGPQQAQQAQMQQQMPPQFPQPGQQPGMQGLPPQLLQMLQLIQQLQMRQYNPSVLSYQYPTQATPMTPEASNVYPPLPQIMNPGGAYNNTQSDRTNNKLLSAIQVNPAGKMPSFNTPNIW